MADPVVGDGPEAPRYPHLRRVAVGSAERTPQPVGVPGRTVRLPAPFNQLVVGVVLADHEVPVAVVVVLLVDVVDLSTRRQRLANNAAGNQNVLVDAALPIGVWMARLERQDIAVRGADVQLPAHHVPRFFRR